MVVNWGEHPALVLLLIMSSHSSECLKCHPEDRHIPPLKQLHLRYNFSFGAEDLGFVVLGGAGRKDFGFVFCLS